MLSNWRNRPRPTGKPGEQGTSYNRKSGKAGEGETVAAGPVVAEKRSNARGAKGPCCTCSLYQEGGRGEMIKAPINLQDLRRRLYIKAKTEPTWYTDNMPVFYTRFAERRRMPLPILLIPDCLHRGGEGEIRTQRPVLGCASYRKQVPI
jgi:hypothetical protein